MEMAKKYIPPRIDSVVAAQKIWDLLGDTLDSIAIFHNQILVAKFSPEKVGSLFRADQSKNEDRWQSKVGLVLKKGPMAFVDDDSTKFHGQNVKLGQWVFYRSGDGYDADITPNGWSGDRIPCRMLEEAHIKGVLKTPDLVY